LTVLWRRLASTRQMSREGFVASGAASSGSDWRSLELYVAACAWL